MRCSVEDCKREASTERTITGTSPVIGLVKMHVFLCEDHDMKEKPVSISISKRKKQVL